MTYKLTAEQEKENRRLGKLSSGAEKKWRELGKPPAFIFRGHAVWYGANDEAQNYNSLQIYSRNGIFVTNIAV